MKKPYGKPQLVSKFENTTFKKKKSSDSGWIDNIGLRIYGSFKENHRYLPMSYWSGRPKRFPIEHKLLSLPLVAHGSYIVRLY